MIQLLVTICLSVLQGEPPVGARGTYHTAVLASSSQPVSVQASVFCLEKYVALDWTYPPDPMERSRIKEAVSYWPTDVTPFDTTAVSGELYSKGKKIAVAGKRTNGNTVIEIWKFTVPPIPQPIYDINTGEISYPSWSARVGSKDVVYDRAAVGMDTVVNMFECLGEPDCLLVQFWDSRDLYKLNTTTGQTELLYASSGTGANVISRLAVPWVLRSYGDHAVHGYFYALFGKAGAGIEPLLLLDSDRDGEIDAWSSNWAQMGFEDISGYVRFHG